MIAPTPPPLDKEDAAKAIVEEKSRRTDVLARLRKLVTDAQTVERRVIGDYARADQERQK